MSFCHVKFNRVLADLELQPLSRTERDLLERFACGADPGIETGDQAAAAQRLWSLGLLSGAFHDHEPTDFLLAIRDRGLLPQLLEPSR